MLVHLQFVFGFGSQRRRSNLRWDRRGRILYSKVSGGMEGGEKEDLPICSYTS